MMEPDVIIKCGNKQCSKCNCFTQVLGILGIIFAFVLGVVIESAFDIVASMTIAYFAAILTGVIIAIVLITIFMVCICKRL